MGVVGRLNQYASMQAAEFDDYSMSENLLTYSRFIFSSMNTYPTGWTGYNPGRVVRSIGKSPDGTDAAIVGKQYDNSGGFRPTSAITLSSSTNYTVSFYARKPTDSELSLFLSYFPTNDITGLPYTKGVKIRYDDINITTGATPSTSFTLTDTWQRFVYSFNSGSDTIIDPNFTSLTVADAYDYNGLFVIASIQVEKGSAVTDYTPTTTTAINRVLSSTTNTNITGFSTYYSSGFDENVGFTTFLPANISPPYDPVYDEFGGTLFGAGQGRYMRQNTDKSVIVYNEIDEVTDFRDIVRTGLVLDLDAAQPLSYKGTGTAWNDLSGTGNNGTLTNGPTYSSENGGSFFFNGSSYVNCGTPSISVGKITVNAWVKITTGSLLHHIVDSSSNTWHLAILSDNRPYFWNGSTYHTAAPALTVGQWYMLTGVQGTTLDIYINGVLGQSIATNVTVTTNIVNLGRYQSGSRPLNGNIATTQIYNRALTSAEIQQNYDALKHRFGL